VKPVRDTDCFVDVDWSQIELVIAAAILGEQNMLHCFEKGLDLHAHSASLMYKKPIDEVTKGERQLGKVCNFGLLYGLSAAGLVSHAATYGVKLSLNEAETIKSKWLAAYPAINDWQKKAKQKFYGYNDNPREHTYEFKVDSEGNIRLEKDGSSDMKKTLHAKTSSGRITYVNTVQGRLGQLLNFPVQGTCADFLITVVCNIPKMARALGSEVKIAMLTYDAITLSVEKSLGERLKQLLLDECITVGYQLLGYPVSASGKVGNTYADVH
jgi:DNA polymerase I-like protein with 3'-5' exonuclease and polymerase domains